ncbi:MAG: L-rhamnose mutarotase [Phycisphaerales bacterium]
MKSYAQALDLADDPRLIEEYRRHHRAVWPEVIAAMHSIGIQRMKIYLVGTRLFMYFEAPDDFDPSRDFQTYAEDPRCQQWDAWMRSYQRRLAEAGPSDWWTPMEEVFDLERA